MHCALDSNLQARTNITTTFDTKNQKCVVCTPPSHSALKSRGGGPVVLVGSDQCFPACLPVDDGEECIRIFRVEDGSLLEVTHALADAIGSTGIQDGTVFLLGSVSHFSKSGTQQYITDWVRNRLWLRSRFGEKCMVLHLFPVSVQGICGKSTVRSIIESLHWVMSLNDTEAVLPAWTQRLMSRWCLRGGGTALTVSHPCHKRLREALSSL